MKKTLLAALILAFATFGTPVFATTAHQGRVNACRTEYHNKHIASSHYKSYMHSCVNHATHASNPAKATNPDPAQVAPAHE